MKFAAAMDVDEIQRSLQAASIGELQAFWTENVLGATAQSRIGTESPGPHGHRAARH